MTFSQCSDFFWKSAPAWYETSRDAWAVWYGRSSWIGACGHGDGNGRGDAFCIMCTWTLGSWEQALKGSQLPGSFIPTQNLNFFVSSWDPPVCPPIPGDTQVGWWAMACEWCTLRKTKALVFWFCFFKSLEFREGNRTAIPACFREGQRRKNVFRMFSRSKSAGSEGGCERRTLRIFYI